MTRRVLPPIEGVPATRAHCENCGKLLKPLSSDTWSRIETETMGVRSFRSAITARHFVRWDAYGVGFCTLRCALAFANAAYDAGYRRTRRNGN